MAHAAFRWWMWLSFRLNVIISFRYLVLQPDEFPSSLWQNTFSIGNIFHTALLTLIQIISLQTIPSQTSPYALHLPLVPHRLLPVTISTSIPGVNTNILPLLALTDDIPGMNDTWDPSEQVQGEVDQDVCAAAAHDEDG